MHTFSFSLLKIFKVQYEKIDHSVHFNDYNCFNKNNHWGKMIKIERLKVDLV